jgi:hypothetical protein
MGKQKQEQTTLFDSLEEEYSTAVLPPEEQKAGMRGWIVETVPLKDGLEDDAPFVLLILTARMVEFMSDTTREEKGWSQAAQAVDRTMGWGGWERLIFRRRPTVGDMLKIAHNAWPGTEGLPYVVK